MTGRDARRAMVKAAAALAVMAMLAAGCTADGESATRAQPANAAPSTVSAPISTSVARAPSEAAPPSTGLTGNLWSTSSVPPEPSTIAAYEQLWAEQRQKTVDAIVAAGFGVDDGGVLHGPGGLRVDLSDCPAGWSPTTGIGLTEIDLVIGADLQSLSTAGLSVAGIESYLDYVTERGDADSAGGVGGAEIEHRVWPVYYPPAPLVDDVISDADVPQPEPFALVVFGLPAYTAQQVLEGECVPQLAVAGRPRLNNPAVDPWVVSIAGGFTVEAAAWGQLIEEHRRDLGRPLRVAALVMDNDFGRTYLESFELATEGSPAIETLEVVTHDQAAQEVAGDVEQLVNSEPDVWISMTAGTPCLLAMQALSKLDVQPTLRIQPSPCRQSDVYLAPVGEAAGGWVSVDAGIVDPGPLPQVYGRWVEDQIRERLAGELDEHSPIDVYAAGFGQHGWMVVELLRIAELLPGGLTRPNLLLAMWGAKLRPPWLTGYEGAVDGPTDPFLIETLPLDRYDAATGSWQRVGTLAVEGTSPVLNR